MIMEIVSILLGILILLVAEGSFLQGGGLLRVARELYDPLSLVIIFVFTVPVLIRGGVWKDFKRAFLLLKRGYYCHLSELRRTQDVLEMVQRQIVCAGIASMLLVLINVLHSLAELSSLGPKLAVAILTIFYATIIEMLLLPLQMEVKRRIIDYMELDEDMEEPGLVGEIPKAAAYVGEDGMAENEKQDEMRISEKRDGDGKV